VDSLSKETDVQDSITLTLNRFPFHIHPGSLSLSRAYWQGIIFLHIGPGNFRNLRLR
jgi:hypothetical protein